MAPIASFMIGVAVGFLACIFIAILEMKAQENGTSILRESTQQLNARTFFKEEGMVIEPKTDQEIQSSLVIEENEAKGESTKIEDIL